MIHQPFALLRSEDPNIDLYIVWPAYQPDLERRAYVVQAVSEKIQFGSAMAFFVIEDKHTGIFNVYSRYFQTIDGFTRFEFVPFSISKYFRDSTQIQIIESINV